ncbi:MAG TPA: flavodoxin family protein [Coriobacteriia bacterium]
MSAEVAPRVLGIAGSPRRGGNSDRLLEACLKAARLAGAETDLLVVADAGIAPCRGCNTCSSTGDCVVHDGAQDAYARIDAADAIVIASPVYFATVPATLKALYDRCQQYWARRYVLGVPLERRRPGAYLIVGGGGDPYGHECAVTTTRSVFAVLGVDYSAELFVRADTPSEVGGQPAALARAEEIGTAIAQDAAERLRRS